MTSLLPYVFALFLQVGPGGSPQDDSVLLDAVESERAAAERARAEGDHARVAQHLERRGAMLSERGWYAAAIDDLRAAVREAELAGDSETRVLARVDLGEAVRWIAGPAEALECEETALAELGDHANPRLECRALLVAGDACFDLRRFEEESSYFERMIERAQHGSLEREAALAWSRLGLARLHQGDLSAAEECREKATSLAEKSGDERTLAQVRLHASVHLETLGRHEAAAHLLEQVLDADIPRKTRLDALGMLGNECKALGRVEEGRRSYEDARALATELGLHSYEARFLLAFANIDSLEGNLPAARVKLEQARDLLCKPHESAQRADVLLSLGQVLEAAGDPEAFDAYSGALDLAREACDRSIESRAAKSLSIAYLAAGRMDAARRWMLEARFSAGVSDDVEAAAAAVGGLAWIELEAGHASTAVDLARESLRLYRLLGMDWQSLEILDTLAEAGQRAGNEALCEEAVQLARGIFDGDFLRSSDLEACARLRAQFAVWAGHEQALTAMKVAHAGSNPAERARLVDEGFSRAGGWKARALLGGLVQRRKGGRTPERIAAVAALESENETRLQILGRVSAALRAGEPIESVQALVAQAEAHRVEAEELATRLRQSEANDSIDLAPTGKSPVEVREALADDRTVLVEYAESASRLYAYVLSRSSLDLIDLGDRKPIELRVAEFAAGLRPEAPAARDSILRRAHELYEALLAAPLRSIRGSVDQIVVVPSSLVARIPFEALVLEPPPASADRSPRFADAAFVIRKYAVTYAPSTAVLVALTALPKRGGPLTVLGLVDPSYARPGKTGTGRTVGLDRLEYSREEGLRIARLLVPSANGTWAQDASRFEAGEKDVLESDRLLLLAGRSASARTVRKEAGRFSILHIAAHGFADFSDPDHGALALSSPGGDDEFLTYRDVMRLPLAADLTVLSACETGLGRDLAGEGVLSLARAFTLAGSRSVVATLWPVYDRQTSDLMEGFYRAILVDGATVPVALQRAKLKMLSRSEERIATVPRGVSPGGSSPSLGRFVEPADPCYWAAFVCVGPAR